MDDDPDQRQEDAELQWRPVSPAATPLMPGQPEGDHHDPGEGEDTQDAGRDPKIQHDVVRVDEAVGVGGVPIGSEPCLEAREAGAEHGVM